MADVPRLAANWVIHFDDPCPGGFRPAAIDTSLLQFGHQIQGTGHLQGHPGDPFEFRGLIKRNVFYGSFYRKDAHLLAGTGTFVLKIAADSRSMIGHCIWYDSLLDDVWSSKYVWTRSY